MDVWLPAWSRGCCSALVCTLLACGGAALAAPGAIPVTERNVLYVGYQNTALPFSYLGAHGRHVGYSVDLCAHVVADIEHRRGRKFEAVHAVAVSSKTRIPLLLAGKIDLECGSTTHTLERERLGLAFSLTIFVSDVAVLVRREPGAPARIQDLQRLQDPLAPIVTTAGSTSARHLRELDATLPEAPLRVVYGADHGDSFRMLADGRASAFVMDRVLLAAGMAAFAGRSATGFTLLEDTVTPRAVEHYALMMRDADADLKRAVDETLTRLMGDGGIEKIYAHWFQEPIAVPAAGAGPLAGAQPLMLGLALRDDLKKLFRNPSGTPYLAPAAAPAMR